MKRYTTLALLCALLLLCGCAHYPSQAVDGAVWDRDWTILGSVLGVEAPGDGLSLLDNNIALASQDIYYATWTAGEPTPYVNADGDDVDLYDAQLYLLLCGCADDRKAQDMVDEWMARQNDAYDVSATAEAAHNGVDYTLLTYACGSETNPYARGVSAFAVYDGYAVSAELTCVEGFSGDEAAILARFLDGCHYGVD